MTLAYSTSPMMRRKVAAQKSRLAYVSGCCDRGASPFYPWSLQDQIAVRSALTGVRQSVGRCAYAVVGACCDSCASGHGSCEGGGPKIEPCCQSCARGKSCDCGAAVGRAEPTNEIVNLDSQIEKLRDDLVHHEPPPAPTPQNPQQPTPQEQAQIDAAVLNQTNWAALSHKLNAFVLRWGQFKTRIADDWWWGDDDDVELTGFKTEYNGLLKEVQDFTLVDVTAEPVDTTLPPPDSGGPGPGTGLIIGVVLAAAAIGTAAWFLLPPLLGGKMLSSASGSE